MPSFNLRLFNLFFCLFIAFNSCTPDDDVEDVNNSGHPPPQLSYLNITIKFDSTQDRLDNQGNIAMVLPGHGAQSPTFNAINIGFIELLTDSNIPFGAGVRILEVAQGINGNDTGYFCCNSSIGENYTFNVEVPGNNLPKLFKFVRVYFVYENYTIKFFMNGSEYYGTVAGFLASKSLTYNYQIQDSIFNTYVLKYNGDWAMEVDTPGFGSILQGSAFVVAPNVLYQSSPVPAGCIVTCAIDQGLYQDIVDSNSITLSISSNKCFEWVEHSNPNYFEPFNGDSIYDIGIRGIKIIQ